MNSPYNHTLVNHNMRYIYWPHFDGDPTSYWQRMGFAYIGGPQVINTTEAPAVFRSPYMFARKVDPAVDASAVALWDEWMAKKLKGERPADQQALGGVSRDHAANSSLERKAARAQAQQQQQQQQQHWRQWRQHASAEDGGEGGHTAAPGEAPTRLLPRARRVRRVLFEDGSACECAPDCRQLRTCCDEWQEICTGPRPAVPSTGGVGMGGVEGSSAEQQRLGTPPPCPSPIQPPPNSEPRNGSAIRLTFLNHAPFPVRLFHRPAHSAREVEMGSLRSNGASLSFRSSDAHAWAARSWGGAVVLEVPPRDGRPSSTIDIFECDLRATPAGRGVSPRAD
jgi:hypothetical protein